MRIKEKTVLHVLLVKSVKVKRRFSSFKNRQEKICHDQMTPVYDSGNVSLELEAKNIHLLFTTRGNRTIIHRMTGKCPSELVNGRKLNFTIPQLQCDQAPPEIRQK